MKCFYIFVFLASVSVMASEFPQTLVKIKCLNVDANGMVIGNKSLVLLKDSLDESTSEWSIEEYLEATHEYSSLLDEHQDGFSVSNNIISVLINFETQTKNNYLNKKQMEPFFIKYNYKSNFFNMQRAYTAKCLHLLF